MTPSWWTCPSCATRNERVKQKCSGKGCNRRRPKKRVAKHAVTLRDDAYAVYVQVAKDIHGIEDESCCVCGRPRHESMHHHRDHDHVSGLPRGVVCFQCNRLMPRQLTLERAELVVAYLRRVEAFRALSGAYTAPQEAS